MFVVSFYSYKGGVGRSVALMNTAHQLASSGRRVLILDFDLEAPGLHSACSAVWPHVLKNEQPGFIDFFNDYVAKPDIVPAIEKYISPEFGPGKLIRLLSAGNLSDFEKYSANLLKLNEMLLAPITSGRELLLKMRDDLAEMGFDYLLIDSRTGHTDILGATTVLLPHLVVFITNLSSQSLTGTRSVINWVQSASDAAIAKKRPPQAATTNRFFLRSIDDPAIQMLIVASPVPLGDHSAVTEAQSERGLGKHFDHLIYYVPQIAAHETRHVAKRNEEDPVQQYKTLADRIRTLNPFEPSTLVDHGMESLERQDWTRALSYFDAADHFLQEVGFGESDQRLKARCQYGKVRALALGFQTKKAREVLDEVEQTPLASGLEMERLAANLQMVRGHLASNELSKALQPALKAVDYAQIFGTGQGRFTPWEILARLQLGDVYCFLGKMQEAESALINVPKQANALNRAMERAKAYQLLATAQALNGGFSAAESSLAAAIEQAKILGVTYLISGCAFVRAVIDLTNGNLHQEHAGELAEASRKYLNQGDGLNAADCLAELGIYHHRLGSEDHSISNKCLEQAWRLYTDIAGTALGQVNVLLYFAEIKSDRGQLFPAHDELQLNHKDDRPSAYSAHEALMQALTITQRYGLPDFIREDIKAWLDLMLLFQNQRSQRYTKHDLDSEVCNETSEPIPQRLARKRNRAFRALLKDPTLENRERLEWVAQEAGRLHLGYSEAITRTLVAVGYAQSGENGHVDAQFERIQNLVTHGNLGWSVWGQVRNVQRDLRTQNPKEWQQKASSLLTRAEELGLFVWPVYWQKDNR